MLGQPGHMRHVDLHVYGPVTRERRYVGHVYPRDHRSSPARLRLTRQEGFQLCPSGQPLVIAQGRDAERSHGVGHAQALSGLRTPERGGQVPGCEGITCPDRVHHRYGETRRLPATPVDERYCAAFTLLQHDLAAPVTSRQALKQLDVGPVPQGLGVLLAKEEDVHARQEALQECQRLGGLWDPLESTCRHASLSIL